MSKLRHTRPASSTRIRSQSIIVFNLWAIISIVPDLNSSRIVFCIKESVLTSTAAVASSRTMIFDLLNNALARLIICLCPTLKFSPPSKTLNNCSPVLSNNLVQNHFNLHFNKTCTRKDVCGMVKFYSVLQVITPSLFNTS